MGLNYQILSILRARPAVSAIVTENSPLDSLCPSHHITLSSMKLRHLVGATWADEPRVVARFGGASLTRDREGKWQLRGGTRDDRQTAREWISLFLHEAVVHVN